MKTLADRLDHLAANYQLQVGPLLLLLAVGAASSPVLAWTAAAIMFLSTLDKIHRTFFRTA